jgi:hypothetical protein
MSATYKYNLPVRIILCVVALYCGLAGVMGLLGAVMTLFANSLGAGLAPLDGQGFAMLIALTVAAPAFAALAFYQKKVD